MKRRWFLYFLIIAPGCSNCFPTTPSCDFDLTPVCRDAGTPPPNMRASSTTCTFVCIAGFGDCNGGVADGCETPLGTASNCSACGFACSPPGQCQSGVFGTPACIRPDTGVEASAPPPDGWELTTIVTLTSSSLGLAWCNGVLYWLDGPMLKTSNNTLAVGVSSPGGLACGTDTVLFADVDAGAIHEVSADAGPWMPDGGASSVVVDGVQPSRGIAVVGDRVFWRDANGLRAIDRSDGGVPVALLPTDDGKGEHQERFAVNGVAALAISGDLVFQLSFEAGAPMPLPTSPVVSLTASNDRVFAVWGKGWLSEILSDGTFTPSIAPIYGRSVLLATSSYVLVGQSVDVGFGKTNLRVTGVTIGTHQAFNVAELSDNPDPVRFMTGDDKHVFWSTDKTIWRATHP